MSNDGSSIEIIDQSHGDQVVLIQLAILDPNQFMSFSKIFRQKKKKKNFIIVFTLPSKLHKNWENQGRIKH